MNNNGSIVNISSHLGVVPCTESPAYCVAAAGIINFTKATALEYADKKIRANSICLAFTPTPLSLRGWKQEEIDQKLKETPLGRFATPEDTAKLCLFLLSDDASFITGENIWINGGRLWIDILAEQWLNNLKEYWLNKDVESAVSLFTRTTYYQETPFMKPYTTIEKN